MAHLGSIFLSLGLVADTPVVTIEDIEAALLAIVPNINLQQFAASDAFKDVVLDNSIWRRVVRRIFRFKHRETQVKWAKRCKDKFRLKYPKPSQDETLGNEAQNPLDPDESAEVLRKNISAKTKSGERSTRASRRKINIPPPPQQDPTPFSAPVSESPPTASTSTLSDASKGIPSPLHENVVVISSDSDSEADNGQAVESERIEKVTGALSKLSTRDRPQTRKGKPIDRILEYRNFNASIEHRFLREEIEYPPNFPNLSRRVSNISLGKRHLETLLPYGQLFGDIIEAFFIALQDIASSNGLKLLSLDSYFAEILLGKRRSVRFQEWVKRAKPQVYDLWLVPMNINRNHWTLLLVALKPKVMVYFDSMHGDPPKHSIRNLMNFLNDLRIPNPRDRPQQAWDLYIPQDIPRQQIIREKNDMNCGIHVCMWGYLIASGSRTDFRADQMDTARRGVAKFVMEYPYTERLREREELLAALLDEVDKGDEQNIPSSVHINVKYQPPAESTVEFCRSLKTLIDAE